MYVCTQDPADLNAFSKIRVGRLLGRVHAAKGEHALSVSALNSALEAAKTGELLLSEALVVRERSRLGKANSGGSLHWDASTGQQRLSEVMGRMDGTAGGQVLLEKLLLG